MFQLTAQQSKIAHLNVRKEKHGQEEVTAVDIKVEVDVPNDFLSYLNSTLKSDLYGKYDNAAQGDLVPDPGYLPRLKHPEIKHIKWTGEMKKAQVIIHGATKKASIAFDADVNKLVLECKDGGTVSISFRVQVIPEANLKSKLLDMLGVETKVTVAAADVDLGDGGE